MERKARTHNYFFAPIEHERPTYWTPPPPKQPMLLPPNQVDICNMTLAIEGLAKAMYRAPSWLPKYPAKQSFKAGTYFPFTVILPVDPGSLSAYSYPSVDVLTGFFACDAALKPLPEDQVVPPPGTGRSSIEADDDYPGSGSSTGVGSKIKWSTGFMASAGGDTNCLGSCLDPIKKQEDDCAGK
jgi:hypothetical protein